jgi:hypothetical protein
MAKQGDHVKLVNALDNKFADELQPLYNIDIQFGKSPKHGVKCGAITVFRLNTVDLNFDDKYDMSKVNAGVLQEIQDEANKTTEVMHQDPILFRETDGRWVGWALDKSLEMYDRYGGGARITVKCPRLRIIQRRSSKEIARLRGSPRDLFSVAWDIDRLLSGNFAYDPWTKKIRRGRIDARTGKR